MLLRCIRGLKLILFTQKKVVLVSMSEPPGRLELLQTSACINRLSVDISSGPENLETSVRSMGRARQTLPHDWDEAFLRRCSVIHEIGFGAAAKRVLRVKAETKGLCCGSSQRDIPTRHNPEEPALRQVEGSNSRPPRGLPVRLARLEAALFLCRAS